MAGHSSLYGREICKKIRDVEYEPFINVCPENVYLKYRIAQKSVNHLIKCTLKYVISFVIAW
jgi:hypothetical protein